MDIRRDSSVLCSFMYLGVNFEVYNFLRNRDHSLWDHCRPESCYRYTIYVPTPSSRVEFTKLPFLVVMDFFASGPLRV